MEHCAVVSSVVCSVLGSPSLVGAAEEGNFFGDEFSGGSGGEVAVVGWVVFFGKNLALSYQNNRKTSSINACGLMAKNTHTDTRKEVMNRPY